MIGRSRVPGRHRVGQVPGAVHRRVWDGPARAEAERLERSRSGWVVLYGTGSRRFYAIAAWPVPEPVMVCAPTAEGLEERMSEAETALFLRATTPAPGPGGAGPFERPRQPRLSVARRRAVRPLRSLPYPPEGNAA